MVSEKKTMAWVFLEIVVLWACLLIQPSSTQVTRARWLPAFREDHHHGSASWHDHPHAHHASSSNEPCLLCPSNVTLVARKGSNCALVRVPIIHSCQHTAESLALENAQQQTTGSPLETEVVRGLRPGTWATEGTHRMVVRVLNHGHPVGLCRIQQQVQVRRCAPLASRNGLTVNCTQDRAWGSKCLFTCTEGLLLEGAEETVCESGVESPRWTHPPPFCVEKVLNYCPSLQAPQYGTVHCTTGGTQICTFGCEEGYVIPRSQRAHAVWECQRGTWSQSVTPQCLRKIPVEAPEEDCMNVTLILPRSGQSLALPVPKFATVNGTSVTSRCNVNEFAKPGLSQRQCEGVDDELETRGYCNYAVNVLESKCPELRTPLNAHLDCGWQNFTLRCNLTCHPGLVLAKDFNHPRTFEGVMECNPVLGYWDFQEGDPTRALPDCEEPAAKMRFMAELRFNVSVGSCDTQHITHVRQVTQQALMIRNQDVCQEANCTQLETVCQENQSGFDVEMIWTVTASYAPIVDYYYDDAHVPEGEALIEKLQVATENMLKYDRNFAQVLRTMGVEIKNQTFRVSMLDLICDTPGYIVDEVTNKCRKCPANTYQHKAQCLACPEGTRQDKPGQSSCIACSNPECTNFPTQSNMEEGLGTVAAAQRSQFTITAFETPELSAIDPLPKKKKAVKLTGLSSIGTLSTSTITPPFKQEKFATSVKPPIRPGRPLRDEPYHVHRIASKTKPARHSNTKHRKKSHSGNSHRNLHYRLNNGTPIAEKMSDEDPCQPNPCLVGGTCVVRKGEYFCHCPVGYTGLHCEKPRCSPVHCYFGGTCVLKHGQPVCLCPPGRSGSRCELAVKPRVKRPKKNLKKSRRNDLGFCASNPCQNGGRCVDNSQVGFYTCKCVGKYIGDNCQFLPCPNAHHRSFCRNGGQCVVNPTTSARKCLCPENFSGVRCEKPSHSCSNSLSSTSRC